MKRLNNKTKERLIQLIKEGNSMYKTSKELKITKSLVHYYCKKNDIGNRIKYPIFNRTKSEVEGEIIGAFAADGNSYITRNKCYNITFYLGGNETEYVRKFSLLLESFFNKKPYIYKCKKNVFYVRYRSKAIYNFMKEYLDWIGKKTYSVKLRAMDNEGFLKGFIRGYFDCDGYSNKKYKAISMCGVSASMMNQVRDILVIFGFSPKYYIHHEKRPNMKDLHTVSLNGTEAKRFISFIEPRNHIRIRKWD